ncbi:MAG: peptide chain release factor 1 [Clostridiales bacterium]|nr:peptide chain release factor 1 [Clostridiales bacterium]
MLEERFAPILDRYEELTETLNEPGISQDVARYRKVLRDKAALEDTVTAWREYEGKKKSLAEANELLRDEDMKDMAAEEIRQLEAELPVMEQKLKSFLIPRDPDDDRSVIMEIRPGAGGDEAGLFGALLLRMYSRYAEKHGMKMEPVSITDTELGGIKEAVFSLTGNSAFSRMKYESGVHRIQRVPVTEAGGRIHTSTATVAVLPEAEDVEVDIKQEDLRIDTYRASGHGGQYINRTDSAVRIVHLPTGLVVTCQDEKSQLKNKEKAMKVLRTRLYDLYRSQKDAEYAGRRKAQVGSGERNERIRTYNFPQGRVTDHRIGLTLYKIDAIVDGDLDEIIDGLTMAEEAEKMKNLEL